MHQRWTKNGTLVSRHVILSGHGGAALDAV